MSEVPGRFQGIQPKVRSLVELRQRQGTRGLVRSLISYMQARWYLRAATSVGTVRLTGRALVRNDGRMRIGDRVRLDGTTVRLELVCFQGAELSIGDGTYINYGTNISARRSLSIGENCNIGQYCIIMDSDFHALEDHRARDKPEAVSVGNDVWLGARVVVLKGTHIGDGAVVGANSVVKGEVPANAIVAGNPARVIRIQAGESTG